jgi:ABC-2 type transport system permease protein
MSAGILAITRVEIQRLMRSRLTLTLLLLIPALQVILFGFAIRPGAQDISVTIAASSPQFARSIGARLRGQPHIRLISATGTPGSAADRVRAGAATIGIDVPATRSFANPFAPILPVRLTVDDSDAALATVAIARVQTLYWQDAAARSGGEQSGAPALTIDRLYNPDDRAAWIFMPSLVGVTVMIAMIMLGTLGIAREREGGTWETMEILPLSRTAILIGKLVPGVVIGTVQGAMVLLVAIGAFGVPARGSVVALLDALQGAVAFYLPAMLLSGFLYPFSTLPPWAQAIGGMFPLTHFIRAAQSALLHGDDALTVLRHGVWIAVFLACAGLIARLMPVPPGA